MIRILAGLVACLAMAAAGCSLSVDVDTAVTCTPSSDCGEGRECVAGLCQTIGVVPDSGIDAENLPDATAPMIDAMAGPDAAPTMNLTRSVILGSDDAEEKVPQAIPLLTSADLEIGLDDGVDLQRVGIRFQNIDIPPDSTILEARIQFTVNTASIDAINVVITAQANDNAATFTDVPGNLTARTKTTANVAWKPNPWPTIDAAGSDQRTPDLASLVTEVTGLGGWASGNAIVFLFDADDHVRDADSSEGGVAPELTIRYREP